MKFLTFIFAGALLWSCSHSAASEKPSRDTAEIITATDSIAEPSRDTVSLTIAFVGDVMMGTTFPDSIHGSHLPPNGGRNLFADADSIIRSVDIAGGNLEGSFLNGPGQRRKMRNPKTYYIFRMPPEYVDNLVNAGFDFMGIANNHINDFGHPGRKSTMATLRGAGLPPVGLKGVCETAIIERKGLKIGVT